MPSGNLSGLLAFSWALVACGVAFDGDPGAGGMAQGGQSSSGGSDAGGSGATPSAGGDSTAGGGSSTGGSSSAGGTSAGRGADPLVDDGLVARYWIDEASEGSGPTTLQDASPDPEPLTIVYADGLSFATHEGNRALHFPGADQGGHALAAVDGTKLAQLEGATRATLEAVVHLEQASSNGDRIIHFGDLTSRFSLEADSTSLLRLDYNDVDGQGIGSWTVSDLAAAGRVVLHAVLDTSVDPSSDRVRLYVDGVPQLGTLNPPTKDDSITLGSGQSLVLGNRLPPARSIGGYLHYAAVYLEALSQTQIDQNVAALLASDDAL